MRNFAHRDTVDLLTCPSTATARLPRTRVPFSYMETGGRHPVPV